METPIDTVHIIFKTHLDVGYTDFPHKVVERYFYVYFPKTIDTAQQLEEEGNGDRYIWTTGSWLITEYLERMPRTARKQMERAIEAGQIAWHAYPFTAHNEMMDASLFRCALGLSQRLDQRFGRETISAKLTDVPGDTRATIHLLQEAGIRFLHIGVNRASTVPGTPPVFVWQDEEDGSEVIVMYHSDYGSTMLAPGMTHAIHFAFTNDNIGPHTPEAVKKIYAELRAKFPGARVMASTMDAYARELVKAKSHLPVVTQEIGNTWIYGAGTDPKKTAQFRELMRLRSQWLAEGRADPNDSTFERFSRFLLVVPEHTWGLDEKHHLDYQNFSPEKLAAVRHLPTYKDIEASWREARAYLTQAVDALGESNLAKEARQRLAEMEPCQPDLSGWQQADASRAFATRHFGSICFDPQTGGLISLEQKANRRQWAGSDNLLGLFRHQSFSQGDYDRFFQQYIRCDEQWALLDFSKPGIELDGAVSAWRRPLLKGLYRMEDESGSRFLAQLQMPEQPPTRYGLPQKVFLEWEFPEESSEIRINTQWFGKEANRLPEAYWFSFQPVIDPSGTWRIEKIDRMVDPLDVASKGGRTLHGVTRGIFYQDAQDTLEIITLDAATVAPGQPSLLDFHNRIPDLLQGVHFNLYNNKWGTNFPTWYEEDARFRFILRFR